ncbi:ABC transporter permease [Actinoplanes hulinensis]|uniref:ABC transporter permease n=1 Tax=Actinoplanes hulinensis TaxID=1144547 RepID=A0ABS7B1D5_9ACTN|nr:ABC transporter permease [Actinoplanes hulinensis]MBW6434614.1 ABC transporter permease [Actinoplanes hulinensis]
MLTRGRAGTFVAVLIGTFIVTTFLLLLTSGRPRVPDRFAGSAAVVQSPAPDNRPDEFAEPVPWPAETVASLAERLRAVPGVTGVTVDRDFYAQPVLDGRAVADSIHGHAWHGTDQAGAVVDRGLGVAVGDSVTLLTGAGPEQWLVTGHTDWPGVHLPEAAAGRLAPGVRAISVEGTADPVALQAVVGADGTVLTGDERGLAEPRSDARTRWIGMQILTATAAVAGFACVFLVASTSAYEVNQRRREIGLLRAVGATPRQVRAMLYRSALMLGVVASAVGVLLGSLAAVPLAAVLVAVGLEPAGYTVRWDLGVLAAALAVGPLLSLAGTMTAARRVSRVGPMEALRVAELEQRAMSRVRWVFGSVAGAAAVTAGVAAAASGDMREFGTYALLGAMALIAAFALLAPAVVPALIRVLLAPLSGVVTTLARESARTAVRRTASTAAPVLFTVAFAVFVTGTVQTSNAAFDSERAATVPAGQILVPDGTPGLHDGVAPDAPLDTTAYLGRRAVTVIGDERVAQGTALVAGTETERVASVPGQVIVTFDDGSTETLRVTGTAPAGPFASGLIVARDTVRKHDPSALAPAAYPAPDSTPDPGARKTAPADLARQIEAEDDRLIGVFTLLLLAVSAGAGAITVANTLLMTARHRRSDYRALRLAGATRGQVLRLVALETTLAVAIGSLLGGTAGLIAIAGSARSLSAQTGQDVPVLVSWPVLAATVLTCLLLAVGAATIPAARLVRRQSSAGLAT